MCRLFAFRSSVKSQAHRSLMAAENALVHQSQEHPDGWGVAFYVHHYPHVYRNPEKAIEDGLFRNLGSVVSAYTLLAHIRKSTIGENSLLNCHPFQFGNWTFAHNGQIAGYAKDPDLRARILEMVAPRFRRYILGETDSEALFYLFLGHLVRDFEDLHAPGLPVDPCVAALRRTVDQVVACSARTKEEETKLTMIVTNGSLMIGYRYKMPLRFSTWKQSCPESDVCPAYDPGKCEAPVDQGIVRHLILSSEMVQENPNVWEELGDQEAISVDWGMHLRRWPSTNAAKPPAPAC